MLQCEEPRKPYTEGKNTETSAAFYLSIYIQDEYGFQIDESIETEDRLVVLGSEEVWGMLLNG